MSATPTEKKIDELNDLIATMKIAMMTTRGADGSLESRPMATQKPDAIADIWFVTSIETHKVSDLLRNPDINLGYFDPDTMEWLSVSGTVTVSQDRFEIRRLHQADWKVWFDDEGGNRNGGPDDPRLALLLIDVQKVHYMKSKHSKARTLFEIARSGVTGKQPDISREETLDEEEIG